VTALLARTNLDSIRWTAGAVAMCAAIGIAAGVKPAYGIAGALAISFTVAVFANLTVGVALFTTLSFLDVLQFGGGAVTFMKLAGLLLFLSWFARASSAPRRTTRALMTEHPAIVVSVIVFLAWSALSMAWATSRSSVTTETYSLLLDSLLIPIVFAAVNERRDVVLIVIAFIIGAIGSAAYGIVSPLPFNAQDAGRLAGALGEANQQATVLVAALALSLAVVGAARRSPALMLATIVAAVLAFIGLVQTESRAGLVSFGAVLLVGVVVGGRWRKYAVLLVGIGVAAVTVYFIGIASQSAKDRVTMTNTSGRSDLWTVAWRAFESNPLLGVGSANFDDVSVRFLDRPGVITAADVIVDTPKVAHNIYLEQLADLGIPGLVTLLAVFGYVIAAAWQAAQIFTRIGDRQLELLSRCTILALVAFMTADFFASELTSKQLWLVIALCPALLKLARDSERRALASA
jgi:O-antigen ligase